MLRLLPEYADAQLVRSRDPAVLGKCDIVVDVGGQYDGTKRFDHHQREFAETFSPKHKTKLSSAGLVYKHFGPQLVAARLHLPPAGAATHPSVQLVLHKLYSSFIEALDANDNGIAAYPADVEPAYEIGGITLPQLVGGLNRPSWKPEPSDQVEEDTLFQSASQLVGEAFERTLDHYALAWLPAREFVESALQKRTEHDADGRILVLERLVPWKDHLFSLEEAMGIGGEQGKEQGKEHGKEQGGKQPLYVLYPEASTRPGWRIQCVPAARNSFASRRPLPEAWRGLRDAELSTAAGIDGCIFVHASGFTGGNKTFDGVVAMAHKALAM